MYQFLAFGFSGLPLFKLSSFRISRNLGVHGFRFTEIPGFGVFGFWFCGCVLVSSCGIGPHSCERSVFVF